MKFFRAFRKLFGKEVQDGSKKESASGVGSVLGADDSQRNPPAHTHSNPVAKSNPDEHLLTEAEQVAEAERVQKIEAAGCSVKIDQALRMMGYSLRPGRVWLKPVGFSCFVFREEPGIWYCYFKSYSTPKLLCYSWTEIADHPNPLRFLKEQEAWHSRINIGDHWSQFEHDPVYVP